MEKNGLQIDSLTVYSLGQGDVFKHELWSERFRLLSQFYVQILTTLTTSIVAISRIINCPTRANTFFCQAIIAWVVLQTTPETRKPDMNPLSFPFKTEAKTVKENASFFLLFSGKTRIKLVHGVFIILLQRYFLVRGAYAQRRSKETHRTIGYKEVQIALKRKRLKLTSRQEAISRLV